MNIVGSRSKAFLLFVAIAASTSVGAWGAAAPDSLTLGRQYTAWFYAGETDRIWQVFSPEMKKALGSAAALKEFRDKVIQQAGQETHVLSEHLQPSRSGALIYERLASFSAAPAPLLIRWEVESDGTVTGFTIQPAASLSQIFGYPLNAPLRLLVSVARNASWGGPPIRESSHTVNFLQRFASHVIGHRNGSAHGHEAARHEPTRPEEVKDKPVPQHGSASR